MGFGTKLKLCTRYSLNGIFFIDFRMSICEMHALAAQIRVALLRDGQNIAGMAKEFGKSEDLIREILRKYVFDLSKAEMAKELKAYELVVLKGLRPSVAALQMHTGEEDVRYLLQNLLQDDDSDSEDESEVEVSPAFTIHIVEMMSDSDDSSKSEGSEDSEDSSESEESEDSDMTESTDEEEDIVKAPKHLRMYFDHKDVESGRDVLTVRKNEDHSYTICWVFNETDESNGSEHSVYYYTNREFMKYMKNLLKLTKADKMPFRCVELHVPGYPAFTFTPSALKKSLSTVLEAIHDNFVDM